MHFARPLLAWALVGSFVTASACTPRGDATPATKVEQPAIGRASAKPDTPPPRAAGPLEISMDGELLAPSRIHPPRAPDMMDHPFGYGWTASSERFVVCKPGGGRDCDTCTFHHPGDPMAAETLEAGSECDAPSDHGGLDRRLRDEQVSVRDGDWAHGGTLILVAARERLAAPGTAPGPGDGQPVERLRIGVRRRGDPPDATRWVHDEDGCVEYDDWRGCAFDVHLDVVAPSPDGETLGLLIHGFAGEYTDTYFPVLLDADTLAAAARRP